MAADEVGEAPGEPEATAVDSELRRTAARRPPTAAVAVRQEEGEGEASNPLVSFLL